jgi:hypothetical protein
MLNRPRSQGAILSASSPIRLEEPEAQDILAANAEVAANSKALSGYEGHVLRMLNVLGFRRKWAPDDWRKLVIAAAFHDLDVFGSLDYLGSSNRKAMAYLDAHGLSHWKQEIALIIHNHHGLRRYTGTAASMVEPFRQADWTEVSVGLFNFGVPRSYFSDLRAAIPYADFYPGQIFRTAFGWWRHHPLDPFPNFRTHGGDDF